MNEPLPNRETNPVDHFLAWLIAMDDPNDERGMRARQTVTLSYIIDRAREVKTWVELDRSAPAEREEPCPSVPHGWEPDSAARCVLPTGHEGDHQSKFGGQWGGLQPAAPAGSPSDRPSLSPSWCAPTSEEPSPAARGTQPETEERDD